MAEITEDRVAETTTTTGTGALALAAAIDGYRRFSSVMAIGDTCYCTVEAINAQGAPTGEWETGRYTYTAANELTRTSVSRSSNGNAAVDFGAGTKRVFMAVVKSLFDTKLNNFGSQMVRSPAGVDNYLGIFEDADNNNNWDNGNPYAVIGVFGDGKPGYVEFGGPLAGHYGWLGWFEKNRLTFGGNWRFRNNILIDESPVWHAGNLSFGSGLSYNAGTGQLTASGPSATSAAMQPHKWWRIFIHDGVGFFAYALARLQMRATAGGADQCTGGTPFARAGAASNAFDTDAASFWSHQVATSELQPFPTWLGYEFASPVTVAEVALTAKNQSADDAKQAPQRFIVQYSDDGLNYYDAFAASTSTYFTTGQTRAFGRPVEGISTGPHYHFGTFAVSNITASEILMDHVVATACTLADEFAGCRASVGANPAASWVASIQVNGNAVGTLTIGTNGAVTFTTTGTTVPLAVGDVVTLVAPGAADTSIARLRVTFKGTI